MVWVGGGQPRAEGIGGRKRRGKGWGGSRGADVPDDLAREPEEGLLEVVVRFCGDFEVLEVLLAVEGDLARLDLPLLRLASITRMT